MMIYSFPKSIVLFKCSKWALFVWSVLELLWVLPVQAAITGQMLSDLESKNPSKISAGLYAILNELFFEDSAATKASSKGNQYFEGINVSRDSSKIISKVLIRLKQLKEKSASTLIEENISRIDHIENWITSCISGFLREGNYDEKIFAIEVAAKSQIHNPNIDRLLLLLLNSSMFEPTETGYFPSTPELVAAIGNMDLSNADVQIALIKAMEYNNLGSIQYTAYQTILNKVKVLTPEAQKVLIELSAQNPPDSRHNAAYEWPYNILKSKNSSYFLELISHYHISDIPENSAQCAKLFY